MVLPAPIMELTPLPGAIVLCAVDYTIICDKTHSVVFHTFDFRVFVFKGHFPNNLLYKLQ